MITKNRHAKILYLLLLTITSSNITAKKNLAESTRSILDVLALELQTDIAVTAAPQTKQAGIQKKLPQKEWTFITYVAADNDLEPFVFLTLKRMANIGSNENINIVVHLDIHPHKHEKSTLRYYVEKDKLIQTNTENLAMDSGSAETLISCCSWAIQEYPAKNYALILWSHGSGPLDPFVNTTMNQANEFQFLFNSPTKNFKRNKTEETSESVSLNQKPRGICWDDTTGNYLTNQKLDTALEVICREQLNGQKFSIIGYDACLMSSIEIANITKRHGEIMVASQQSGWGYGWNYESVLAPFQDKVLDKFEFAEHMVTAYEQEFARITNEFTQSAIDLTYLDALEENVHQVAGLLLKALKYQKNKTVKNAIRASTNRRVCTQFDEPSYKDMHHFYQNLLERLHTFSLSKQQQTNYITKELKRLLNKGQELIKQMTIANTTGNRFKEAQGLSIYWPGRRMHSSYPKTIFAKTNNWAKLIEQHLRA